ncbi:cassette chromosome ssDNA-binding protein [Staphylococcus capitis]|uniref:cassette chromosome ssDNA-binding protein n=1 Tax=Staphylococcus capitis TaxID=29388 RepID=UPI0037CF05A4
MLKRKVLGIAFNLKTGAVFTFNDLNLASNVICPTTVQQEVGRWFAYFVKHAPSVPFIIIGKNTNGHLVYMKVGPNPLNDNNPSKGGVR